ncbi:hypothetical protein FRC11_004781 [Ceratobasidium sp. 423]|nr:hypothetical protein FRC11_004781 [Ceratobasidium sp. 423]
MNPNADPHSPPQAPVHFGSAGRPSTTPSSPIVGAFGQWGEQSEALLSSAMGSFVNKAKAMWRGKRHSYQSAGSVDLRGDKDTSRPATQRQATLPLHLPSTFAGFSSPGYERRTSLPATIDGHSKCDRYSRSMSASTLVPPDTSYLTVGPPRAGSAPNLRGCGSTEFAPSVDIPSEYDAVCCASPRMMDGLELGVSDTMVAIEAGFLQSSESEDVLEDTKKLRGALANMFPMTDFVSEGSLVASTSRECAKGSHDIIDRYLEDESSPLYPLRIQERDEFEQLTNQSAPESVNQITLATDVVQSLWIPQDSCRPHLWSSSLYRLEIQSLAGPEPVETVSNDAWALGLDVMFERTTPVSRPSLKPLYIEDAASRSTLHVPLSVPPRVPARSPSRPNLRQRARNSSSTSTLPGASLRVPSWSCTPDSSLSKASVMSGQVSEGSFYTARSRRTSRSLFVESQVAQAMRPSPVPGPSRSSSLPRKGRSQSRLAKMKSKSKSVKKPTPADISKPIRTEPATEWIVISSSRTLHHSKASRSSFRRSSYAQSSISSRHSGMSRASTGTGIVKSPSVRSGLTSLSTKPGLRASQSRSALHTKSRARLYSHGVNPKLSAVALQMTGLHASSSTRSLAGASKESLTPSMEPHRPPRSPARPHPERRLEDMNEKENQPTPMPEGESPLEFTLQLAAPFEAGVDRRFARSNFAATPPSPGLHRSRTTRGRPSGVSRKQELHEVHTLVAGMGGNGAPLRRAPTVAVPPRNPARVAMSVRTGNWI